MEKKRSFKDAKRAIGEAAMACEIESSSNVPLAKTDKFHFYTVKGNKLRVVHAGRGKQEPTEIIESSSPTRIIDAMKKVRMGCELGRENGKNERTCSELEGTMIDGKCHLPDNVLDRVARVDGIFSHGAASTPENTWDYLIQANALVPIDVGRTRDESRFIEIDKDTVARWFKAWDEEPVVILKNGMSKIDHGLITSLEMETIVGTPIDQDKNVIVTMYRTKPGTNKGEIVKQIESGLHYLDFVREKLRPMKKLEEEAAKNYVKTGRGFLELARDATGDEKKTITRNFGFPRGITPERAMEIVEEKIEEKNDWLLERGILDVS